MRASRSLSVSEPCSGWCANDLALASSHTGSSSPTRKVRTLKPAIKRSFFKVIGAFAAHAVQLAYPVQSGTGGQLLGSLDDHRAPKPGFATGPPAHRACPAAPGRCRHGAAQGGLPIPEPMGDPGIPGPRWPRQPISRRHLRRPQQVGPANYRLARRLPRPPESWSLSGGLPSAACASRAKSRTSDKARSSSSPGTCWMDTVFCGSSLMHFTIVAKCSKWLGVI